MSKLKKSTTGATFVTVTGTNTSTSDFNGDRLYFKCTANATIPQGHYHYALSMDTWKLDDAQPPAPIGGIKVTCASMPTGTITMSMGTSREWHHYACGITVGSPCTCGVGAK